MNMQASKWAENPRTTTVSSSQGRGPSLSHSPAQSHNSHNENTDAEQFAQTRQPDDLFDDEFTPIPDLVSQPAPPLGPRNNIPQNNLRNERPTHGRGRGRGRQDRPLERHENTSEQQPQDATTSNETVLPESDSVKQFSSGAVRGNRLQTGGIQKPKLTEDELSARLEAAKINNARREEAHRLAEADEASFQHRETQAREKRREEGVARRAMEGERERNRLRKLGARGNREWDEAKKEEEEEFTNGRSRGYRRGMHGGLSNNQKESGQQRRGKFSGEGEDEELSLAGAGGGGADDGLRGDFRGRGRDRGRGGKGRGRGGYDSRNRGGHEGGRGDYGERRANHHNISAPQPIPAVNVDAEFPKISSGNAPKQTVATNTEPTALTSEGTEALKSPIGEKTSWADQVEAVES